MIFLDIKQYCQNNCNMFEADVEKLREPITDPFGATIGFGGFTGDTIIRCKHRDICERMRIQFSHPNEEDLK